jgi:hypothetical protein
VIILPFLLQSCHSAYAMTQHAHCAPHSFFLALAQKERMRRARCKKEKGR